MDQSNRYADLSLREEDLIRAGRHILVAYKMKPKAGHDYLPAAAHFAAESSTGTNVEVCTTDDFTRGVDALVYHIDEASEEMRIAYPLELFDRNVTDGRMMIVSFLTLVHRQQPGDGRHRARQDLRLLHARARAAALRRAGQGHLRSVAGPRPADQGRWLHRRHDHQAQARPAPGALRQAAAYQFWLGGDFIKNDEPQGNQVFAPMKKVMPLVYDAMKRAQDETGQAKIFSANITADDHYEMCARADYILETFGPMPTRSPSSSTAMSVAPAWSPPLAASIRTSICTTTVPVTAPSPRRVRSAATTAYVLAKMSRLQGASGFTSAPWASARWKASADDRAIAYIIERDEYQGPAYYQKWYGMKPTTPIISGGMNALRLPGFFANLGHGNVINTSGGGSYGHIDSPAAGAISLRQAYECWKAGADPIEWAREHRSSHAPSNPSRAMPTCSIRAGATGSAFIADRR
jgi:ribulose-bisphosphate carboxylase large chain